MSSIFYLSANSPPRSCAISWKRPIIWVCKAENGGALDAFARRLPRLANITGSTRHTHSWFQGNQWWGAGLCVSRERVGGERKCSLVAAVSTISSTADESCSRGACMMKRGCGREQYFSRSLSLTQQPVVMRILRRARIGLLGENMKYYTRVAHLCRAFRACRQL